MGLMVSQEDSEAFQERFKGFQAGFREIPRGLRRIQRRFRRSQVDSEAFQGVLGANGATWSLRGDS